MAAATVTPAVFYKDPMAAIDWLQRVFGFEVVALITDPEGKLAHSELTFRGASLSVGGEWEGVIVGPARMRSPATVDGVNTQFIRIHMEDGLDAHHAHARSQGANITDGPSDQFYGSRTYRAVDPEGHVWNFSQEVRVVSAEEMERATGLKVHTPSKETGHG